MSDNSKTPVLDKPAPAPRVRLVGVVVSLEVVADDGITLHPIELQPIRVSAVDWPAFSVDATLAQLQTQLEGEP